MSEALNETNSPRRILIWPGTYDGSNLGDVAMLQVAVERLHTIWPRVQLTVVARKGGVLQRFCPGIKTIPMRACRAWLKTTRDRSVDLLNPLRLMEARRFERAVCGADLLLLAGCGMIADAFQSGESRVLRVFQSAIERGIPAVMVGQGLGPMRAPELRNAALEVFPKLTALFLRDPLSSHELARELGVPEERIIITGDDAVELAFRARNSTSADAIGVNLRLAPYSGLDWNLARVVQSIVLGKAKEFGCSIRPIAIASGGKHSDAKTLQKLFPRESMTGFETPEAVIRGVGTCGLIVAGSYHAGVFALAQGIPVVAIVNSEYYAAKFAGLAAQFGCGCAIVRTGEDNFEKRLASAIDRAWTEKSALRAPLLSAAQAQIAAGQAACRALAQNLCASRSGLLNNSLAHERSGCLS